MVQFQLPTWTPTTLEVLRSQKISNSWLSRFSLKVRAQDMECRPRIVSLRSFHLQLRKVLLRPNKYPAKGLHTKTNTMQGRTQPSIWLDTPIKVLRFRTAPPYLIKVQSRSSKTITPALLSSKPPFRQLWNKAILRVMATITKAQGV